MDTKTPTLLLSDIWGAITGNHTNQPLGTELPQPDMNFNPRSGLGQFSGAQKVAVNISNSGPPVEMTGTTRMDGDTMVLDASMRLAETNSAFRRTFVNQR